MRSPPPHLEALARSIDMLGAGRLIPRSSISVGRSVVSGGADALKQLKPNSSRATLF